jgi:hypothetical protein
MKIPMQEKIAELESRIAALEKGATKITTTTTTTTRRATVDLDPEWSGIWKQVDALFAKVFKS